MICEPTSGELARHIAANPLNLARVAGYPPLSPHWIAAARFEAEGRQASNGEPCPYNAGTMAACRWLAGNGERHA
jgi:hypothetical protein